MARARNFALVVVVLGAVLWLFFPHSDEIEESSPPAPSQQTTRSPVPEATPTEKPSSLNQDASAQVNYPLRSECASDTSLELRAHAVCFIEAYELVLPDDTTESYSQRIEPFVSLDFVGRTTLDTDSVAASARMAEGVAIVPVVDVKSAVIDEFDHNDETGLMQVSLAVSVEQRFPSGKSVTGSMGRYYVNALETNGRWRIVSAGWF